MKLIPAFILLLIGVCFASGDYLAEWRSGGQVYASKPTTCPCGIRNKQTTRIVNGRETMANEYPFMLALFLDKTTFICGGSILTERYGITAGHCTRDTAGYTITAVAGLHNMNSRYGSPYVQEVDVASHIEHEQYYQTKELLYNDIALLYFATPLKFNRYVTPLCMPVARLNIENKMIRYIGWGQTGGNDPTSTTLQTIDHQVRPYDYCKKNVETQYGIPYMTEKNNPRMFCTVSVGKTPCSGDSGGPVVYLEPETQRYTLVGLVSFGDSQCVGNKPAVAADVAHFIDWIRTKVRDPLCTRA